MSATGLPAGATSGAGGIVYTGLAGAASTGTLEASTGGAATVVLYGPAFGAVCLISALIGGFAVLL